MARIPPRLRRLLLVSVLTVVVLGALGAAGLIMVLTRDLPDITRMMAERPPLTTRIYARDGSLVATLYDENREWRPLNRISPLLAQAMVAVEDQRFYAHSGLDPVGVVRSTWTNLTAGEIVEGASTITMQLARSVFGDRELSMRRKIREAALAARIEATYSKDQIMELYLNWVYFGSGAYGVQAASRTYFGKDADALAIEETAMLAALPASPEAWSPFKNPQLAANKRNLVLQRMADRGLITDRQRRAASARPLQLAAAPRGPLLRFPYYTAAVIRDLSRKYPRDVLYRGGLQVYTELDPRLQAGAERALRDGVRSARRQGYRVGQGALVTLEPGTGAVRAMVGGTGWSLEAQFNRAWQAVRQPGSTFKIVVYAAALEEGASPATTVVDAPVAVRVSDTETYRPKNADGRFWGPMSLAHAFRMSRDVPAVRAGRAIGLDRVAKVARAMGISSQVPTYPSLPLGAVDTTPLEMALVTSVVANRGMMVEPRSIRVVLDGDGRVLEDNRKSHPRRAISETTAVAMTEMMRQVITSGTGTAADIGRPAAGKTGTTDHHRDAWFVGFTADYVTAVWTGNDDNSPTGGSYGGTVAAPIWADFMRAAHKGLPARGLVTRLWACPTTGLAASSACPDPRPASPGALSGWCPLHGATALDAPKRVAQGPSGPVEVYVVRGSYAPEPPPRRAVAPAQIPPVIISTAPRVMAVPPPPPPEPAPAYAPPPPLPTPTAVNRRQEYEYRPYGGFDSL